MIRWIIIMSCLGLTSLHAINLHVATTGRDDAPGTEDAPLATLAGARDRIRALPADHGPVTVWFAKGVYRFSEPVAFGAEDSGSKDAPIVYRAEPGATVRLSGGVDVEAWQPVQDPDVREQLPEASRGQVRVADLKAAGITDYGKLQPRGFAMPSHAAEAELFYNETPMTLARWPNEGFRGINRKHSQTVVELDTDRLQRWVDEKDPWIFAYWHHDWAEVYEPIVDINAEAQTITRSDSVKPRYGITAGRARWYALNLLSELDQPGEYYLDRETGKLYFYPPEPGGRATLSISNGLVRGTDLSFVTFRGFIIEAYRANAISLQGGLECHVVGCVMRNIGRQAVSVTGGDRHEVFGCDIRHCGEGGVYMAGGDRKTLTPAGHNVENNHIHHYSRRCRTYRSAVAVRGVGNRIAHNLIHDGPHMALSAGGNEHIVEYNEIHNVVYESGDAGAYYVGRDWTQRGNVLRYNYWHHIVGATGHGGMTIYLDDQHSGHTIHGNLFERCSRAVFIGGGDDNIVTNNVFVDCWKAAHIDNRGMGWQKNTTDDPNGPLRTRLRAMPYKSDLWAAKYPTLPGILEDEPNVPKRNVFRRNVSSGGRWNDIHQGTRKYQVVEQNIVHDQDKDWVTIVKDERGNPVDLVFKDPEAVADIGFKPLPLKKIGLFEDERRATWPVEHTVRPISLPEPKPPKPKANLPENPTYTVPRDQANVTPNGTLIEAEWLSLDNSKAMMLTVHYDGALVTPPAQAWITHNGTALRVAVRTPLAKSRKLGTAWGGNEAVELAMRAADGPNADTLVLRGFTNGTFVCSDAGGAGEASLRRLRQGHVRYGATVDPNQWTAEWIIPLQAIGVTPGDRLRFNLTVRRTAGDLWVMWRPTHGDSTRCERVGTLELAP